MKCDAREHTLIDLRGETNTLCEAETFFGDMSGRAGKAEGTGDPGASPVSIHNQTL